MIAISAGQEAEDLAWEGEAGHAHRGDGVRDEPVGQPELRPGQPLPVRPAGQGHGELEIRQVQIQGMQWGGHFTLQYCTGKDTAHTVQCSIVKYSTVYVVLLS